MQPAFVIKEAISFGWKKTIENIWFLAVLTLVFLALSFAFGGVKGDMRSIFQVLNIFVSYFAMFSFVKVSFRIYNGVKPTTADILEVEWSKFGHYVLAAFISALIIGIGFIFLIVPGIYLSVCLSLVSFATIIDGTDSIEALKKSWALTRKHFWPLFGLTILLGLINIVAAVALAVGLLITIPMTILTTLYVYEKLKAAPVVTV